MGSNLVLVTGATGFIASRCILQLLEKGYLVRGTVRNLERAEQKLRQALHEHTSFDDSKLSFVRTDLTADEGWTEACSGCRYVLHLASPIVISQPKDPEEMIRPACDGTRRVLTAAAAAGVEKTVMTSSSLAVGDGQVDNAIRTESDWHDITLPETTPYQKSKKLAEELAWDLMKTESIAKNMRFSVVCPSLVLGPCIENDYGISLTVVKKLMNRELPGVPRIGFPSVDVRDVARLHIDVMESSAADGERFLGLESFLWMQDIGRYLNEGIPKFQEKPISTRLLPDWLIRIGALFDSELRAIVPVLGKESIYSNEKAKQIVNWTPQYNMAEAVTASGESLMKYCNL